MTDNTQLKEDIAYVRAVAERSRTKPVRPIYLLWAMIGLCGFVLVDFVDDKKWISIYWLFAAPTRIRAVVLARFPGGSQPGRHQSRDGNSPQSSLAGVHDCWRAWSGAGPCRTVDVARIRIPVGSASGVDLFSTRAAFGAAIVAYRSSDGGRVSGHGLGAEIRLDRHRSRACHRARDRSLSRSTEE